MFGSTRDVEYVINQATWNNNNIINQNSSIFNELGVVKIRDLISETGNFLQILNIFQVNLSPGQHFKLRNIVDAIPLKWTLLIKQNQQLSARH